MHVFCFFKRHFDEFHQTTRFIHENVLLTISVVVFKVCYPEGETALYGIVKIMNMK